MVLLIIIMSKTICNIDFGNEQQILPPLYNRQSIAFLLGAGFSVPKGYPAGDKINEGIQNFDDYNVHFELSGSLAESKDGSPQENNIHQKYFIFCKRLIKEYTKIHNSKFDYELFYDFIKSEEAKKERYQLLCADLIDEYYDYNHYLHSIIHIYNQMVLYLLKDKDGKSYYDDEPFRDSVDGYDGFLQYLAQLSKYHIINIHTLNHDLLFESFNQTNYINNQLSDGFDEYRSQYYGILEHDHRKYICRLQRYTGRYNTPIRLYKLHGSIDYVLFSRNKNGIMVPEKYVKSRRYIGNNIIADKKSKLGYDESPFEYHPDFLTGATSKINRYNESLLFKKLFKKFKNNLSKANRLIIIGYGCKDKEINNMIKNNFDYKNKPSFIIDECVGNAVKTFAQDINAKIIKESIKKIDKKWFI